MKGNNNEVLCVIKGTEESFELRKNTIYRVQGRFDQNAPTGLQKLGVSKIPFSGNGDRVLCRFDNYSAVYDTGFYASSRCYRSLELTERSKMAKMAYENIGRPYEEMTNVVLNQSNYEFWDDLIIAIDDEQNNIFDTGNPIDAFKLYIAVLSRKLMPEELDGDPKYADAYYKVIDTTTKTVFKNEYDLDIMTATARFITLLNGDEEQEQSAKDLAIFLGFYDASDVSKEYLMLAFNNYLKADAVNVKDFSRAYSMYQDPKDYEILKVCRMLAVLGQRGKTEVNKKGFHLNGRLLGKERKAIAEAAVINPKKAQDKMFIIEAYDALFEEKE